MQKELNRIRNQHNFSLKKSRWLKSCWRKKMAILRRNYHLKDGHMGQVMDDFAEEFQLSKVIHILTVKLAWKKQQRLQRLKNK